MVRSASLLCAGLIAVLCVGCVPAPAQQPPLPPPPVRTACPVVASAGLLPASFRPTNATVTPQANGPAPPNMQANLLDAYDAAPDFFKARLCGLNGIFVTEGPQSWGYRNIATGGRYIALSTSLWDAAGQPITLDRYHNRVFGPPLSWTNQIDPAPPTYLPATPNHGTMTILAALAHEYGHVLWSEALVWPPGQPPQSARFCNGVLNEAWVGQLQPAIWKGFEDADPNPKNIGDIPGDMPGPGQPGSADAKVLRMLGALDQNRIERAHQILWRILARGRPFPSLLGAYSANEQFVETFMLYTLMRAQAPMAPLISLPLQVSPGFVRDIPATLAQRPRLSRVLTCMGQSVNPTNP